MDRKTEEDWTAGTCEVDGCGNSKFDCCYNCEKSICREHAEPYVFVEILGNPTLIFSVCPECEADLDKLKIRDPIQKEVK